MAERAKETGKNIANGAADKVDQAADKMRQ